MAASIIFLSGPEKGRRVPVGQDQLIIGRSADCTVVFDDALVSKCHAIISHEDGRWVLCDQHSRNGTRVNNRRVRAPVVLADGDMLQMGDYQLKFELDAEDGALQTLAHGALVDTAEDDVQVVKEMRARTDAIRREVGKVIVGQREVLDLILMCMMAGGHALLIGLPGMAKTTMVRTLSDVLDLHFKRVQFTPDLMPSDITGTEILTTNGGTGEKAFRFLPGPIFCNILLADEINRTPPKTQAALLEAMEEKRVTVGNDTYEMELPFLVLATQNPIEQEGTYPLPEAQMDRFMFNIWIDYPTKEEETQIVTDTTRERNVELQPVLDRTQILQLQQVVRRIPVSPHVVRYTIDLVRATRPEDDDSPDFVRQYVSTGAGPRAGQYLILAAKARAVLEGRIHVSCADVRRAARPVLRHRVFTNFAADSARETPDKLIMRLLETVKEPRAGDYA